MTPLVLMKHPELGAAHFDLITATRLDSEGWTRWPRTKAQKAGCLPTPAPTGGGGPGVPTAVSQELAQAFAPVPAPAPIVPQFVPKPSQHRR